ncbi:hypothetical protein H0X48_00365 [Candidatus Dependentiae bacterium]|nr:hypothetical protein [Candidatus Dependentiae bacterium]
MLIRIFKNPVLLGLLAALINYTLSVTYSFTLAPYITAQTALRDSSLDILGALLAFVVSGFILGYLYGKTYHAFITRSSSYLIAISSLAFSVLFETIRGFALLNSTSIATRVQNYTQGLGTESSSTAFFILTLTLAIPALILITRVSLRWGTRVALAQQHHKNN